MSGRTGQSGALAAVSITDAKTVLSRLLDRVAAGFRSLGRLRGIPAPPDIFFFDPFPDDALRLREGVWHRRGGQV